MEKILIVEDELIVARDIRRTLEREGHKITGVARTAESALSMIHQSMPTLVLLDIFLKGNITGIDLALQLNHEELPFIFISANSNQHVLEAAKATDPYGFIVKPFRAKDLLVAVDIARYRYDKNQQMKTVPATTAVQEPAKAGKQAVPAKKKLPSCDSIIGRSSPMLHVLNRVRQVAPFDTSVLLLGESGTGKEGIANCIVEQSPRHNKPFIKVNCAALPPGLMEMEFFGYEKGAFTGATERKAGRFELAAGGTILLDEIGEMPIDLQAKLLRVLQEGEIQRIGGSTTIKVDVRIIAATNRDLEKEVAEGRFRLDFYYRLHVFPVSLPPLRERKEDIPLLVQYFVQLYARKTGKSIKGVDDAVMVQLLAHDWPGNVRELQYLVERSVLMTEGERIQSINLIQQKTGSLIDNLNQVGVQAEAEKERAQLVEVLERCNFKIAGKGGAAELLNVTPAVLYAKIKRLGIGKGYV